MYSLTELCKVMEMNECNVFYRIIKNHIPYAFPEGGSSVVMLTNDSILDVLDIIYISDPIENTAAKKIWEGRKLISEGNALRNSNAKCKERAARKKYREAMNMEMIKGDK